MGSSPYDLFGTDESLETGDGVELDYGDFKITIHRAGGSNAKFKRVMGEKTKPLNRRLETGTLEDDVAARTFAEVYAESVIIGWKGVTGEDGKPMAFNKKNVVKLLTDLPDLFGDIQRQANQVSNFRAGEVEGTAKN